jgi:UDP-2,3-diacylglucosamine pyrophosphatase LpxH
VSDVHVGLVASQVEALCRFLESHRAAELYLVGDIVDLEALERRPRRVPAVPRLVRLLYRLAHEGTHVRLIPGNHDAALRAHVGREDGLDLHHALVYVDGTGRRLLVTHGDEVDRSITCHPALSRLGGALYDVVLALSVAQNTLRRAVGLRHWNLAGALKRLVKRACTYVGDWEALLVARVQAHGLDGVICGHIHVPRIGELHGVSYLNCGDWVEHATALAETWSGDFVLLSAHDTPDVAPSRAGSARPTWRPESPPSVTHSPIPA